MKLYFFPILVSTTLALYSCGNSGSSGGGTTAASKLDANSVMLADDNVTQTIKNSQNPYYVITNRAAATLSVCAMDANGNLGNCVNTGKPGGGSTADAVGFTYNNAFITRHGTVSGTKGEVTVCQYDANTGSFNTCADSGAPNLKGPEGLKIFNNSAYVVDSDNDAVKICPNANSGILSICNDSGISKTLLKYPTNITFKGTKAYIVNFVGNSIVLCDYNSGTGGLDKCASMPFNFNWPHSISFHGTNAYVSTTATSIIAKCPLNEDGTLGKCTDSGATNLKSPRGNVQFINGFAYVASTDNNIIYKCPVNTNGTLGNCVNSGATGITTPFSIDKVP